MLEVPATRKEERAMLRKQLDSHMQDRALEWFSGAAMLLWGLILALPGETMAGPSYAAFHRFGTTEEFWAYAMGATGIARLVALFINGRWPRTPLIRMVGALFGLLCWSQITYLLLAGTYLATGVASTGPAVYGLLALADLFSIFRAAFDARYVSS